jgi:two-component system CheB/CheR fusion protein
VGRGRAAHVRLRRRDIVGQKIDVLFTPEDRDSGIPQHELETARERGRAEDERWHVRKDGSRFYCSGVTTALARDRGLRRLRAISLAAAHRYGAAAGALRAGRSSSAADRGLQAEVTQHADAQDASATLLRKVVTAQEDERARIARDLHDHLGQQ